MYEPIAENKNIALHLEATHRLTVRGDRDLLIEAVANLVDNAIKFTPEGGRVDIELLRDEGETVVRVTDTGCGISEQERDAVQRRFYRSDKIRNTPGVGLGLNLVAAIVKLHGFRLMIFSGPGCRMEIICPDAQALEASGSHAPRGTESLTPALRMAPKLQWPCRRNRFEEMDRRHRTRAPDALAYHVSLSGR